MHNKYLLIIITIELHVYYSLKIWNIIVKYEGSKKVL